MLNWHKSFQKGYTVEKYLSLPCHCNHMISTVISSDAVYYPEVLIAELTFVALCILIVAFSIYYWKKGKNR